MDAPAQLTLLALILSWSPQAFQFAYWLRQAPPSIPTAHDLAIEVVAQLQAQRSCVTDSLESCPTPPEQVCPA